MSPLLKEAVTYWEHIAPIVKCPKNHKEYKKLIAELDALLTIVGDNENHKLMGLVDVMSVLIENYEMQFFPATKNTGINALKFLMNSHQLTQKDFSEIGSQGVVSEILSGKRQLNLRQIKLLAKRFHVSPETFMNT